MGSRSSCWIANKAWLMRRILRRTLKTRSKSNWCRVKWVSGTMRLSRRCGSSQSSLAMRTTYLQIVIKLDEAPCRTSPGKKQEHRQKTKRSKVECSCKSNKLLILSLIPPWKPPPESTHKTWKKRRKRRSRKDGKARSSIWSLHSLISSHWISWVTFQRLLMWNQT